MEEEMFPSHLFLSADMWLLSTAIYLVTDVEIQEYISIAKEPQASVTKEIHQIAIGSFKAGKLELQWDPIEEDYWVNPDIFLQWCIKKSICENSTMLDFYRNTVMKEKPFCLANAIEKDPGEFAKVRKMQESTVVKHRTLAMVEYKIKMNAQISLDQLIKDEDVRSIGGCGCYTDGTISDWIKEAFPHYKNPVGRPPNNC